MATASSVKKIVTTFEDKVVGYLPITEKVAVSTEVPAGAVLTLSDAECRTLAQILASVGGSRLTTARKYADGISDGLRSAGYRFIEESRADMFEFGSGSLQFKPGSVEALGIVES